MEKKTFPMEKMADDEDSFAFSKEDFHLFDHIEIAEAPMPMKNVFIETHFDHLEIAELPKPHDNTAAREKAAATRIQAQARRRNALRRYSKARSPKIAPNTEGKEDMLGDKVGTREELVSSAIQVQAQARRRQAKRQSQDIQHARDVENRERLATVRLQAQARKKVAEKAFQIYRFEKAQGHAAPKEELTKGTFTSRCDHIESAKSPDQTGEDKEYTGMAYTIW